MDLSLIFLYHLLSTQNNNSAINQLSFNVFFLNAPPRFLGKKNLATLDCRETMRNGKGGSTLQGGFPCLGMDIGS